MEMKVFFLEHNQVLQDIKREFEITTKIEEADRVVLWNDVNPLERGIIKYARSLRKKVIAVQHGRRGTSRYYPPFNEKIVADKLCVWGESDKKALIENGQDPNKIVVTGTTIFSHLKPRQEHKGINIVFSPEHWDRTIDENTLVRKRLRSIKGVKIITKIIDSPSHEFGIYDNPVFSNRHSPDHLDICADVLSTADLVVGISESTFELLAQSLDIPVVIMNEWKPKTFAGDDRYFTYRRIVSSGSKQSSLKELVLTIKKQLENPDELKSERAKVCIDEGGFNLNSLELLKKEIYG